MALYLDGWSKLSMVAKEIYSHSLNTKNAEKKEQNIKNAHQFNMLNKRTIVIKKVLVSLVLWTNLDKIWTRFGQEAELFLSCIVVLDKIWTRFSGKFSTFLETILT